MTIPEGRAWTAGEKITAAKLLDITNAINFLANPIACHAYRLAAFNVPNNAFTVVSLDAEDYDNAGAGQPAMHSTSTDPTRIVIQETGRYLVQAAGGFASNATGVRGIQVRLNAAGSAAGGVPLFTSHVVPPTGVSTFISDLRAVGLTAGDYVELFLFQSSGGSLAGNPGVRDTYLRVLFEGTSV